MQYRALKYRMFPTSEQETQTARTYGCVRVVYNQCLDQQEEIYASGGKYMNRTIMNNYCNHVLKEKLPFLREVDKFALTNAVFHLDDGYQRMFQGQGRHPKHKSKHKSRRSYTTNYTNGNIEVGEDWIKLPKLGKVKAAIHRHAKEGWILKSATVSQDADGKTYCSVLYEIPDEPAEPKTVLYGPPHALGLDYKSDGLYTDSEGWTCGSPKYYRKAEKRLARLQKQLARKQGPAKGVEPSKNYEKTKRQVAKAHRKVACQRKDHAHKKSTAIAKQYDLVGVETLDMKALSNSGFGNGKATLDNGYGMFLDMLKYKLEERGKVFLKADRWYPSSQLCSCCGHKNPDVKDLGVRKWTCPECGTVHDRDINAAVNVRDECLHMYYAGAVT